jgi:hypothetical protein
LAVGVVIPLPLTVADRVRVWPALAGFEAATRAVVVDCAAAVTLTETAGEVLARQVAAPVYWAVKLYVPAAKDAFENVATPERFRVPVPSSVEPFMKLTVPVGEVVQPFTVAVRTRAWPAVRAPEDTTRLVVVA